MQQLAGKNAYTRNWVRAGIVAAAVLAISGAHAATYYVDASYNGVNGPPNGSSTRPYTNITAAATAAATAEGSTYVSDTFFVADGVYASSLNGGVENFGTEGIAFRGAKNGVNEAIRGGYVGQVSPGAATMDWSAATRVARSSVVDLTLANARAFRRVGNGEIDWGLEVDGFTFRNGSVSTANYHGGVLGHAASDNNPQHDGWYVYNCLFTNNATTGNGGAINLHAQWNRSGLISDCTFVANRSTAGSGGAVYVPPTSFAAGQQVAIQSCTFVTNTAALHGGALAVIGYDNQVIPVTGCSFDDNLAGAAGDGGAVYTTSGGNAGGFLKFYRCAFRGNAAQNGSAVYGHNMNRNMTVYFENCLLTRNRALAAGGYTVKKGTDNDTGDDYGIDMRHCTVVDNVGGGLYSKWYYSTSYGRGGVIRLQNSIIASNGAYGVYYDSTASNSSNGIPSIAQNNNVYGHTTANYSGTGPTPIVAVNSIATDARFADRLGGDYRLALGSPCVDNGQNLGIAVDLNGVPRPTRYGYDMGCYEEKDLPALVYLYPMAQINQATPRAKLSYVPPAYPTDAWIVLDTADKGTNSLSAWWQSRQIVAPAAGAIFAHTFTGLDADKTYFYRVWMTNGYGTVWGDAMTVRTLPTGAPLQLLWMPASANLYWSTAAAETNWTANAGMTRTPWVQGASAVFEGLPASTPRVQGGGLQFSAIKLTGAGSGQLTIGRLSGGDADYLVAVGGAVVESPAGTTASLPVVQGSAGLTVTGGGLVSSSRGFWFSGGIRVPNGTFQGLPSAGNGAVQLLDASGSANATLSIRGANSNWTMNNAVTVQAGSTGLAMIENSTTTGSGFTPTLAGNIALASRLLVRGDTRIGSASFTLSGDISGTGELQLDFAGWGNNGKYVLRGDNSRHSGPLTILNSTRTGVSVELNGVQGNANITVPVNVALTGTGTLICNVADDTADKVTLGSNASMTLSNLTLQPNVPAKMPGEYPIITPKSRVVGTFGSVVGRFSVAYAGTVAHPNDVVLIVPAAQGTVVFLR